MAFQSLSSLAFIYLYGAAPALRTPAAPFTAKTIAPTSLGCCMQELVAVDDDLRVKGAATLAAGRPACSVPSASLLRRAVTVEARRVQ